VLSLSHAPSFTTYRETGTVSKNVIVTDNADVTFEVTKLSEIQIFRGKAPDPTGVGAYWESLHCSPRPPIPGGDRVARYPVFQGSSRISAPISRLPDRSYPGDEISRISIRTCQSPVTTHGDTLYRPCIVVIAYGIWRPCNLCVTVHCDYNTLYCYGL